MLRGKWAGGCQAAGLWSGAGIFTNAGYQARGIVVNQESPESDLGRRVPGGRRPRRTESPIRLGPCSPYRVPACPRYRFPLQPFLAPASLMLPRCSAAQSLGPYSLPPVLAPTALHAGRRPGSRTMTFPLPSPCKFRYALFFSLCRDLLPQQDSAWGTSSARGEGPRRKPGGVGEGPGWF